MKLGLIFIFLLMMGVVGRANEPTETKSGSEKSPELMDKILDEAKTIGTQAKIAGDRITDESQLYRQQSHGSVLFNYSPIDLILPGKKGLSLSFNNKEIDRAIELEYLKASVGIPLLIAELGKMQDERINLNYRYFGGRSSFNWFWGLSYNKFEVTLGHDLLNSLIPGSPIPNVELMDVSTLGFNLGIGNRFQLGKSVNFAIDWLAWSQPIIISRKVAPYLEATNSESDRDKAEKTLGLIAYLPRLSIFKMSLGFTF
jgi:hypothetical protein